MPAMPRSIQCSNCRAPLTPDPQARFLDCGYCGHHLENPYHPAAQQRPDPVQRSVPGAPKAQFGVIFAVAMVLVIGGIAAVSFVASQSARTPPRPRPAAARASVAAKKPDARPLSPQRLEELKIAPYIGCLNQTFERVSDAEDRYRSWRKKDPEAPPTCRERYITYGIYDLGEWNAKACQRALEQAGEVSLALPELQRAVTAYAGALAQLQPLTARASAYYNKKKYELDDCAGAQELHPKLLAAFKQTAERYRAARALLVPRVRGTLQRCLERTEGQAEQRPVHLMARAVKAGGDLISTLRALYRAEKPDLAQMKAAVAAFVKVTSPLEGLDHTALRKAGSDPSLIRALDKLGQAGVAFLKRKGGRRFGHSQRTQLRWGWKRSGIAGTFEHVVAAYQAVLQESDALAGCGGLLVCLPEECPNPR